MAYASESYHFPINTCTMKHNSAISYKLGETDSNKKLIIKK